MQEEDREITLESQVSGDISPDQAQALVLRYIARNRDFYGGRYVGHNMVWRVLGTEERAGGYGVRLSYRLARGFHGKAGTELVTIDRTGRIELRRILAEPRPTSRLWLALSASGVVAVAGAVAGGLFAAGVLSSESGALPPSTVSVSVTPETASQLVSPQGDVTVDLEAGSVAEAVQLLYQPLSPEVTPLLPPGYAAGSRAFDLSVVGVEEGTDASHIRSRSQSLSPSASAPATW